MPSAASDFTTRLTAMKTWLAQRGDWVDSQYIRPPVLSLASGIVTGGQVVNLTAPAGTIYRSLNGTDPRLLGGAISPSAAVGNAVTVSSDTKITARVNGSPQWSAQTVGVYVTDAVAASAANLAESEIHYHPAAPTAAEMAAGFTNADDFEFVEIVNTSAQKVSLAGAQFTRGDIGEGIAFSFNDGSIYSLAPGARAVIAKSLAAFTHRYGALPIAGEYNGRLDNDGDTDAALVSLEHSTDLANWITSTVCAEELRPADGSVILQWTLPDAARWFLRVRVTQR